ncbi:MAG: hypothetical protein HY794_11000, partial [Desulfarculus sp.]|nr:hypothetical protein [Desulfarculus sp.]
RPARWLYGLATGLLIFSGMAQLPMMKRYYLADLPGLAWTAEFFVTSNLHYLAAALLLALLAWRLGLLARQAGGGWSWGPRGAWGWSLLALLMVTGAGKALRNAGVYLPPDLFMVLGLIQLGAAMAFMFTGLGSLIKGRKAVESLSLARENPS